VADAIVRAQATRWVDDRSPGWIEVMVVDAAGRDHRIVNEVPILTTLDIRSDTSFPVELWIRAESSDVDGDHVTARLKWVETQEGLNELVIATADVRWLSLRDALNSAVRTM
jgi:hypothetical protein